MDDHGAPFGKWVKATEPGDIAFENFFRAVFWPGWYAAPALALFWLFSGQGWALLLIKLWAVFWLCMQIAWRPETVGNFIAAIVLCAIDLLGLAGERIAKLSQDRRTRRAPLGVMSAPAQEQKPMLKTFGVLIKPFVPYIVLAFIALVALLIGWKSLGDALGWNKSGDEVRADFSRDVAEQRARDSEKQADLEQDVTIRVDTHHERQAQITEEVSHAREAINAAPTLDARMRIHGELVERLRDDSARAHERAVHDYLAGLPA